MGRPLNTVLYCVVFVVILQLSTSSIIRQDVKSHPKSPKTFYNNTFIQTDTVDLQNNTNIFKVDFVESILTITEFVESNILENTNETKDFFKEMERLLDENSIIKIDIVQNSTTSYSDTSNEIIVGLTALLRHLEDPINKDVQKDFYDQATTLPKHLENLFDGLLGQNHDIMSTLRDLNKCHARKLQEQVESVTNFIQAGYAVHVASQRLMNASQIERASFQRSIIQSSYNMSKRLEDMLHECRTNESKVNDEMREIIEAHQFAQNPPSTSPLFNAIVADVLLRYLEDKYDTKMWVVVVKSGSEFGYFYQQLSCILSNGFHKVKVRDTVAAAISTNRADAPQLSSISRLFLKDFEFPYTTKMPSLPSVYNDTVLSKIHQQVIERYLDIYLELMRTQVDTEVLIARGLTENETGLIINVSVDLPYTMFDTIDNNDNLTMIFVPVRLSATSNALNYLREEHQNQCQWNSSTEQSGPLKNYITDLYLTVEDKSMKEGAYIILDCWTNSSSQRWRFVNGQLRNDNDKCLTALTAESKFLYQHDCSHNWTGQIWNRNGLQIVNGFNLCLVYLESHKGYITQDICGLEDRQIHSEYWQNFNADCAKKDKISSIFKNYNYVLIRMAGTKDYITVTENGVYLKQWINEPGQYWRFIDGKMVNGHGKCLIFGNDSWRVEQIDCNEIKSGHQLTYNEKSQITNEKGYCLSFDYDKEFESCSDEIRQIWVLEDEPINCIVEGKS